MYAERKKIPLTGVRIRLSHHRKEPEKEPGRKNGHHRLDEIDERIELKGALDGAQRRRLLEIAGRCWMHRTLSAGVTIRFHLRDRQHTDSRG